MFGRAALCGSILKKNHEFARSNLVVGGQMPEESVREDRS